jgi:hypothetical protein
METFWMTCEVNDFSPGKGKFRVFTSQKKSQTVITKPNHTVRLKKSFHLEPSFRRSLPDRIVELNEQRVTHWAMISKWFENHQWVDNESVQMVVAFANSWVLSVNISIIYKLNNSVSLFRARAGSAVPKSPTFTNLLQDQWKCSRRTSFDR